MKYVIILHLFFFVLSCANKTEEPNTETCDEKICGENQICKVVDKEAICECEDGFEMENNICKKLPVLCANECDSWEECDTSIGECLAKNGFCNKDIDCGEEKYCNLDSHECNDSCSLNSDCSDGEICSNSRKCEEPFLCTDSNSCYEHDEFWNERTNPVLCQYGVCVLKPCKSNDECINDSITEVCNAGICVAQKPCSSVHTVKIATKPFIITTDVSYQVEAFAVDIDNNPINLKDVFTWTTSDNNIVNIDINGLATGGSISGNSEIKAKICNKTSNALVIENNNEIETNKLRITIFDMKANRLSNVSVKINDITEYTDDEGRIFVDNSKSLNNIMFVKEGYKSKTFISVSEKDIVIYLEEEESKTSSGGFKGEFNFDHPTIVDNGEVLVGIAGSSWNSSLLDFKLRALLGMEVTKSINILGETSDINLESGIELIVGEENVISDSYKVLGSKGEAVFWGWGGKTTMLEILPFITAAMNGDASNLDANKFLSKMVSISKTFNHSIKINQSIEFCDNIPDLDDINGNEDLEELIPDFNSNCFPTINLELNQPLSLSLTIKYPDLPIFTQNEVEVQASESASIVSTISNNGMILLSLGGISDKVDEEDTPDGKLEDIILSYPPQHSGIMNKDSIVTSMTSFTDPENEELLRSTNIVKLYKNGVIDDVVDFSTHSYLKLAENAKIIDNVISFSAIPRASFYRVNITDIDNNNWIIYSPIPSIPLSDKPENISEIKSIIVQAITLQKDGDSISYGDLLGVNDSNLDDLIRLVTRFSSYEIDLSVE